MSLASGDAESPTMESCLHVFWVSAEINLPPKFLNLISRSEFPDSTYAWERVNCSCLALSRKKWPPQGCFCLSVWIPLQKRHPTRFFTVRLKVAVRVARQKFIPKPFFVIWVCAPPCHPDWEQGSWICICLSWIAMRGLTFFSSPGMGTQYSKWYPSGSFST